VRLAQVQESRTHLAALLDLLRCHLGPEAPNLRKLDAALQALERVLSQVQASVPLSAAMAAGESAPDVEEDLMAAAESATAQTQDAGPSAQGSSALQTPSPISTAGWTNRDDAYRTLEALATYLSNIEPHSPTPYLIRRAVNWGRLPLPELMAEIMREEGDLNRMVHLLGLRHP
jgi:type VI secretion system protein ImpA